MEPWGTQSVLFVLFKSSVDGMSAADLFRRLTGHDADNIQNNRTITPAAPFFSIAGGDVDDRIHQVTIQPGRVDVAIACPDRQQLGPWAWKSSDAKKYATSMLQAMEKEHLILGAGIRMAVAISLLRNVPSSEEANAFLTGRLGETFPKNAIDIGMQANVRTRLGKTTGEVNRVLKFGTANIQQLELQIVDGGAPTPVNGGVNRYLASLVVDINTLPRASIRPEETIDIWKDLLDEAWRLADDGTLKGLES